MPVNPSSPWPGVPSRPPQNPGLTRAGQLSLRVTAVTERSGSLILFFFEVSLLTLVLVLLRFFEYWPTGGPIRNGAKGLNSLPSVGSNAILNSLDEEVPAFAARTTL